LGLYPFFPRFASGFFGRFRLTGVFEDLSGAKIDKKRAQSSIETTLPEHDFVKRSGRFLCE